MGRHRSPMSVRRLYQLAEVQRRKRALHGAFGQAGFIGQHAQTGFDRLPVLACSAASKIRVNQKGSRLLIMPDDIAHEHVENVIIDWNGSVEARHGREGSCCYKVTAVKACHYTDKRTTLFAPERSLTLDADELRVLGSGHDKTNKICQYPGGEPGPRPRFLHREIGIHHH